ncbi:hypothetical protein TPHA_0E00630 [Tetrapisispora phaffii CBS 4417]|uniref:Protein transport protein SFT2 n=1 Tax=Tetrapisispora phaffii (strain ATCC 24235 / CBS 4417 / NBRC 1672 / NRRL Y-8282 / UCD 70-5) TaxID=1071381 RepID=G8BTD0_TETPH|nr:hypothetical protein TPHA_0E00630 [Tetrapisispora phaffii CBS 4417]CCE63158.1 hypothetical protein TPHA_0E00630 [Tetrapisispora phaffii CBS 4417]
MADLNPNDSGLRDSLNKWYSSRTDAAAAAAEGSVSGNVRGFFSTFSDSVNSTAQDVYSRLPLTNQDLSQTEEPSWFALSRTERLLLFIACLLGSIACFTLCIFLFPVLAIKPRKFGLLWTMGSLLFILAFGFFMGPIAYIKHLTSRERLPFTVFFFSTCFLTIYFAAFVKSSLLTMPCAVLELIAVVYYAISYFPFGRAGLSMLSSFGLSRARGALNI